jgi:hypothetical protein
MLAERDQVEEELPMSLEQKANDILDKAKVLAARAKSWADFSIELFDQHHGLVARMFPDPKEREAFFDSPQYQEINQLLLGLLKKFGVEGGASPQKSGRFVVRLPQSLHAALEREAVAEGVSLNQLVVSKLSLTLGRLSNLVHEEAGGGSHG